MHTISIQKYFQAFHATSVSQISYSTIFYSITKYMLDLCKKFTKIAITKNLNRMFQFGKRKIGIYCGNEADFQFSVVKYYFFAIRSLFHPLCVSFLFPSFYCQTVWHLLSSSYTSTELNMVFFIWFAHLTSSFYYKIFQISLFCFYL